MRTTLRMSERKFNQENWKPLVLPLGLVLVVIFSGLFVLKPKIKEIFLLRNDNAEKRKKAVLLEAKAETLERLSASAIKEKLDLALETLPTEVNLPLLWFTLEQTAIRHSLEMRAFSSGDLDISKDSFECTLPGSKDNLGTFFADLERVLPLLGIEEIVLSSSEGKLEAKFVLKSFVLALEEKIELGEKIGLLTEEEEKILTDLNQFSLLALPSSQPPPSTDGLRGNPFFF